MAELSQHQLDSLQFARRYRLIVPNFLSATASFNGWTIPQIKDLLEELERDGTLAAARLFPGAKYHYLTPEGASLIHSGESHSNINTQALPKRELTAAYARAAFCVLTASKRELLTARDLTTHFENFWRPGMKPSAYYVATETSSLGYILVDRGGDGRWDRILATLRRRIHRHKAIPAYQKLISQRNFEIGVVVVFPEKAERLASGITNISQSERVPIHIGVVPDLINLIAPRPGLPGSGREPEKGG